MYSFQQKSISNQSGNQVITSVSKNIKISQQNESKINKSSQLNMEKYNTSGSNYINNKINVKQTNYNTFTTSPVIIEYEKNINNKEIKIEDNGNFNVHFMKPYFKSKTIMTKKISNFNYQRNNQYINKSECKKQLTYGEDDDNPYSDNNYNYQIQEAQFQQKNPEMPLEIIHRNNEKKFKAHLIQRLKSFKLKQAENKKIPLNVASQKRREENFKNSLKYLLAKQSQPIDIKKELMYYKGYFRFWKRRCKMGDEQKFRRRIKKDRNIRITTVIYKAENPIKTKNLEQKLIIEQNRSENEMVKKNLIINLKKKNNERIKTESSKIINFIFNNVNNEINNNDENIDINNNMYNENNNNIDNGGDINVNIDINDNEQKQGEVEITNLADLRKILPKKKVEKAAQNLFSKIIKNKNKKNQNINDNNINVNDINANDINANDINANDINVNEQKIEIGFEKFEDLKNILPKNKVEKAAQNLFSKIIGNKNKKNQNININDTNEGLQKLNNIYIKKEEEIIIDKLKNIEDNSKKTEAIEKINNVIENEIEKEGFEQLKKFIN